jgi:hypothetical protein
LLDFATVLLWILKADTG